MTSTILELAISLMLFYLLVSGLCSAAQELIANTLRWRAKQLKKGLEKLLGDVVSTGAKTGTPPDTNTAKIFGHPLLAGLKSPRWLLPGEHNPSYIPTESFARVLLDLRAADRLTGTAKEIVDKLAPSTIADFDKQRAAVEKWFDDSMDRVSGWYKRKAHAWLWVIALVVCFVINADSLRLAKLFWTDGPLRQSLVEAAKITVQEGNKTKEQKANDQKASDQPFASVEEARKKLEATTIPLGWCWGPQDDNKTVACWPLGGKETPGGERSWPPSNEWQTWMTQLIGILLSALAVSQGSPFWFDLLSKAVNLRLAGEKPEGNKK